MQCSVQLEDIKLISFQVFFKMSVYQFWFRKEVCSRKQFAVHECYGYLDKTDVFLKRRAFHIICAVLREIENDKCIPFEGFF